MDTVGWECLLVRHWTLSSVRALTCVNRKTRDFIRNHPALGSIVKISQQFRLKLEVELNYNVRVALRELTDQIGQKDRPDEEPLTQTRHGNYLSVQQMAMIDDWATRLICPEILRKLTHPYQIYLGTHVLNFNKSIQDEGFNDDLTREERIYLRVVSSVLTAYPELDLVWLIPDQTVRAIVVAAMCGHVLVEGNIGAVEFFTTKYRNRHLIAADGNTTHIDFPVRYQYSPRRMTLADFQHLRWLIDNYALNFQAEHQARVHLIRYFSHGHFDFFLQARQIFPKRLFAAQPRILARGLVQNMAAGRYSQASEVLTAHFKQSPLRLLTSEECLYPEELFNLLRRVSVHGHVQELQILLDQEPSLFDVRRQRELWIFYPNDPASRVQYIIDYWDIDQVYQDLAQILPPLSPLGEYDDITLTWDHILIRGNCGIIRRCLRTCTRYEVVALLWSKFSPWYQATLRPYLLAQVFPKRSLYRSIFQG